MNTYNTGRVQIGLLYQNRMPYHDRDACALQAALLGSPSYWTAPAWVRRIWDWL